MFQENRIDKLAAIAMISLLIAGCFVILRPFFSAMLWAVILAYSTWPVYLVIERLVGGRQGLASVLMVVIIATILVLPLALLGFSFSENISALFEMVKQLLKYGLPVPPAWIAKLPFIGTAINNYWLALVGDSAKLTALISEYLLPLRINALNLTAKLGADLVYLSLSIFLAFFFYCDGKKLGDKLSALFCRVGGHTALELLQLAGDTIKNVVYGILGTALAQGFLAGIGFLIAGVPGSLLLGTLTCVFSLIPIGPPLIWLPAALWLFQKQETGWAIFLFIWGVAIVSMIDNVLKPYFISKGSNLPFVLVFLGVLGGVLAFGLIGVFLGPTVLAIAFRLFQRWSR